MFANSSLDDWYEKAMEPRSQAGVNKGLVVMLDAHNDLISVGSVDTDFEGFTGLIDSSGSYPMLMQKGFHIKPGVN